MTTLGLLCFGNLQSRNGQARRGGGGMTSLQRSHFRLTQASESAEAETTVPTATSASQSAENDGLRMNDLLVSSRSSDQMESSLI